MLYYRKQYHTTYCGFIKKRTRAKQHIIKRNGAFMSLNVMFQHRGKFANKVGDEKIKGYQAVYNYLKEKIDSGELPSHENYLADNELAQNIYSKKYYLKDLDGEFLENRPEDVFARMASFIAARETTQEKQMIWAEKFYKDLFQGHWIPGGRVLAGAGDLYRLKTLANCFVTEIEGDNIESIYKTASECARTYSYGGGIGVDITPLRPRDSIVHNAADSSTGAVSFMELFSMTTGLIGQSGRRGALMLTVDIKHPDIFHFIKVKKTPNWVTKQVVEQCNWSGHFSETQLKEIEKQVMENTQVRFANISIKVTDEFMSAVEEENEFGRNTVMIYKKNNKIRLKKAYQDEGHYYSLGIPSKDIKEYELLQTFETRDDMNAWIQSEYKRQIPKGRLDRAEDRDVYGDLLLDVGEEGWELAIHESGDFQLYFASKPTGEIRRLVKAREIWNVFVESNYRSAEPGLMFWSKMCKYSPSNYVGRPIISTNPCAEVPLEAGGACNLGSINLSRFVDHGFTKDHSIKWDKLKESVECCVRFLDNVVSWNELLNPLEKQRNAASETRRLGLGIMGVADMLFQMGLRYDSEDGIALLEEVMRVINDTAYLTSSKLAKEKAPSDIFEIEKYSQCPFYQEALSKETQAHIRQYGLRNIAITSIAPTGSISNIIKSFEIGNKNYIGVSGGVEPAFALFYTRRAESFENKFFKVFHSTVQAYIDLNGLTQQIKNISKEPDLLDLLPDYFFSTAHSIPWEQRIQIQGVCQDYIDHSISSTVNLSEDVEPEVISNIYLTAWKNNLKGVTVYRDGSRFPILSVDKEKSEFEDFKTKQFEMEVSKNEVVEFSGDEVMVLPDGRLSTPFHYFKKTLGVNNLEEIEVV